MIQRFRKLSPACLALLVTAPMLSANEAPGQGEKLKIVFLMGQSNMVGHFHPGTGWYLTQPVYVPPARTATAKSRYFNWKEFYWSGIRFATGSEAYNARGKALIEERSELRRLWRSRYYDNFSRRAEKEGKTLENNDWNTNEWGPPPQLQEQFKGMGTRQFMTIFLHQKAEEAGLYKRMAEHIESPENKLHPEKALQLIAKRDEGIAGDLKRVRDLFLNGATAEDYLALEKQLAGSPRPKAENRLEHAKLLEDAINLPIAKRTYITAFGEVAGKKVKDAGVQYSSVTHGPLTIGYGKGPSRVGPEYPFGISFEDLVDGPVLLVKCAWGGTSLHTDWRPPSLATDDKPMGDRLRWALGHIREVLADPGKYHPDYNPEVGYELAGLVWFQGWNDAGNEDYGKQLVHFIKDFRQAVKAPELPVICGLLGHQAWAFNSFNGEVNSGMLHAAEHPELKGRVDLVNTLKYFPVELGMKQSVAAAYGKESEAYREAERIIGRATSKDPTHYHGAAKFAYLTGDAMARKLVNLLQGSTPSIHQEAKAIQDKN
ncbi:sialate O-acetylesterase [Coraliomargarita sinensis]|uniref:sialate O-acetylesterase n=1 Tax=Coraliomargarita sinensis TaxID=2174842 RepID=UPI001304D1C3|nr:sialate O-acetylesterase [Coraliomargarita sinensis]